MIVACSKGNRNVLPGMQWRDLLTGSIWEVVEPSDQRMYSPIGLGGAMGFWCKPVGALPPDASLWLQYALNDGRVELSSVIVSAMLLPTNDALTRDPKANKRLT